MRTLYRTIVMLLPETPMGLLPERWVIEHYCQSCNEQVETAELIDHAKEHAANT